MTATTTNPPGHAGTAVSTATVHADVLDEAYERLHRTGPEFAGWLSNHGPMAIDAMIRLGYPQRVPAWIDRYERRLEEPPGPRWRISEADWREALGDASRLGDWLAFFARLVAAEPWRDVLRQWWPRLIPGAVAAASHGLIRTGHSVRALRERDTAARRTELGQALGYWAARWHPVPEPGRPGGLGIGVGAALDSVPALEVRGGMRTRLAALGRLDGWPAALRAVSQPTDPGQVPAALTGLTDAAVTRYLRWAPANAVMLVHAATAPRAAALVIPELPAALWPATYTAAWGVSAAIVAMYRSAGDPPSPPTGAADEVIARAVAHGDEHVLKFTEVAVESAGRGNPFARDAALRAVTDIPVNA
jgi:hypothetical protein